MGHSVRGVLPNGLSCLVEFTKEGGHHPRLYNGSREDNYSSIMKSGLVPGGITGEGRNALHLSDQSPDRECAGFTPKEGQFPGYKLKA